MSEKTEIPDEIAELDAQIGQALALLTPRQRKFALILGEGAESQSGAAVKSGYTQNRAESTGSRLMTNGKVRHAVELLQRKNQYEHGIAAAWKRQKLAEIVNRSLVPGDEYNAHAANQALRTLCEMDGNYAALQVKHSHLSVSVNLDYQIDLPGRVIEGEKPKPDGGHESESYALQGVEGHSVRNGENSGENHG